jgi:F-type H+-transporting ATPase subunit b
MQAAVTAFTLILAQAEPESGGIGINAVFLLSQVISFGIVFVLLWRWGFPAITRVLDKRQAIIREGIENAERAKRELDAANQRAEEILNEARRQGQETTERLIKNAQQESNRIIEEAQARSEQITQQHLARIQQEANRARAELSRQIVNLSIEAASRVISKSVNSSDNRRLVEEFVTASDQSRNN